MSFLGGLLKSQRTKMTGFYPKLPSAAARDPAEGDTPDIAVRLFDAAQTHRLNKAHWKGALTGQSLNSHLIMYLETIRTRVEFEVFNNTTAAGIINSHVVDMFGEDGPLLQVTSKDTGYAKRLEELWTDWWAKPDVNGQLAGPDMLHLWWRSLWTMGEYIVQIVNADDLDDAKDTGVSARLHTIDPRRLMNPFSPGPMSPSIVLGVERTKTGRPHTYHIANPLDLVFELPNPLATTPIPANEIIHGFAILVAQQARGIPWFTAALSDLADVRDFDRNVLQASNLAAMMGAFLWTDHHSADYVATDETVNVEIQPGMMQTVPPGWKVDQMNPRQPSTKYTDYRKERQGDFGREVDMPRMVTRRDASGHNYASARFDDQGYRRAIGKLRGWIRRHTLDRLVDLVARESELGRDRRKRPSDIKYIWNWPSAPHVDPLKEGNAVTARLDNGTSTYRDECAERGKDWRETIEQRILEKELLEKAGLPVPGIRPATAVGKSTAAVPTPPKAKGEKETNGRGVAVGAGNDRR